MEEVRQTVRAIVTTGGQRLGGAVRSSMNQLQNGVITFSDQFMSQFNDDDEIPDLGDLIPQNPGNNEGGELARVGDRRNRDGTLATRNGNNNDVEMEAPTDNNQELAAMRSGGSGGSGPVSKETPVTPAQPSYALQETHTTTCHWTGYASVIGVDHNTPVVAEFRLTSPGDIVVTSLATWPGAGMDWTKGLHVGPYNDSNDATPSPGASFPSEMTAGSYTSERANWFNYWAKIYEYYTVTGCHYKITMINPNSNNGADIIVGQSFDAFSDTSGSTGNITPVDGDLHEAMQWKHMNWKIIPAYGSSENGENQQIISGFYKPGQTRRNVSNDGDVKTWSLTANPTDPQLPTLKETMKLLFYKAPLAWKSQAVGTTGTYGLNMQIQMTYTVQFKDLRDQARYPRAAGTDITQTIDTHVAQVPN